jgi:uncharacterized protein YdeI (BOF family)
MKTQIGYVGLATLAGLLSFGTMTGAAERTPMSASEPGKPGVQPLSPQELKEQQQKLKRQNIQEQQRLQDPSLKERERRGEIPPYEETPPIGGQKQAGPADFPQPAFPFVTGELLQIQGEFYTLRDAEGKDVRVHVDKGTAIGEPFQVGDLIEVHRTLKGHALSVQKASASPQVQSSSSAGTGPESQKGIVKEERVTLGGAKQVVRGEVLKIDGNNYLLKDGHGNEVRMAVNQNTRMFCPESPLAGLLPDPSASDKPGAKGPEDLSRTAEQKGSEVGPGTTTRTGPRCVFKQGDMIEAEISDMGFATFVKEAGRPQPGQPLP